MSLTPRRIAFTAAILASIAYLATMCRTIAFLDSGEVAAAASTLGIMHPTGYPTLTLLGHLVTLLSPVRDILSLNILAALLAAAGIGVLAALFDRLLSIVLAPREATTSSRGKRTSAKTAASAARRDQRRGDARSRSTAPAAASRDDAAPAEAIARDGTTAISSARIAQALVAALAALFVGFTAIWWEQAVGFEVYALQALLLPLVTLLFVRFVEAERARRAAGAPVGFEADAMLFAVVLGLAFTNHMMTIFLAPAFLVHYAWSLGLGRQSLRRLLTLIPAFVVGLLPYLYLPIRSSMSPRFNWGRPDSWQRFVDHVSGKFAWEWMFQSREIYDAQTSYFFGRLPSELAWAGLAIAMGGAVILMRRSPRYGVWSLLLFGGCVAYAGGYRIYDIELYYPTAVLAVGIWIVVALGWAAARWRAVAVASAAALVVANVALHYGTADRSGNRLAEDYLHNLLTSAPPNAMIFSSNAAIVVTGSYYLQEVERLRPDVTVINHDYLSNEWYVDELRDWKPEMMRAVDSTVEEYFDLLEKGHAGDVRAGLASSQAYGEIISGLVRWQHARGDDAMIAGGVDAGFGQGYTLIPLGLGYLLARDTAYIAQPFPRYRFTHWRAIDPFAANIYEQYGRQLAYRGSYEAEHGNDSLARRYIEYAKTFDPRYDLENARELALDAMTQVRATAEFFARLR